MRFSNTLISLMIVQVGIKTLVINSKLYLHVFSFTVICYQVKACRMAGWTFLEKLIKSAARLLGRPEYLKNKTEGKQKRNNCITYNFS